MIKPGSKEKSIKKQLENIIWHIETNRNVIGDTKTLDDVSQALKNLSKEIEIKKELF